MGNRERMENIDISKQMWFILYKHVGDFGFEQMSKLRELLWFCGVSQVSNTQLVNSFFPVRVSVYINHQYQTYTLCTLFSNHNNFLLTDLPWQKTTHSNSIQKFFKVLVFFLVPVQYIFGIHMKERTNSLKTVRKFQQAYPAIAIFIQLLENRA